MRRVRWGKRLFLPLLALGALGLFGTACNDDQVAYTQQLVAPPGVPAASPRGGAHVIVNLDTTEKETEIAPGVKYTVWTFNSTVPGPMVRARVGDTIEVRLTNPSSSKNTHNIDLHAVNGPGGGAGVTNVSPGETKAFTFKAKTEGFYVYHCAAGVVADHIANGMYGGILIEPANGLEPVDHEYYVGQSEFYTSTDTNEKGDASLDMTKVSNENPPYVVFNGAVNSLNKDKALTAKTGETVRIYFADGGPNLISSFHIIGEIFDKAWDYGAISSPPLRGVQTLLVPPGGATVVQFKTDVPGDYKLVDHAIERVSKGAVGTLTVTGPEDPSTFKSLSGVTGADAGSHEMSASPTAAATTPPKTPTAPAANATPLPPNSILMEDNFFSPDKVTIKVGEKTTFTLVNTGKVPHNMHVALADGNYDNPASITGDIINAGKTGTLEFTPPAAGTYKFRCDIHPDQMFGTITAQ
ncbi:MAG: copper-containing nitrite reductase [Dehalococcoidia bacterium]|nr:copper-containing nitrite reductase [Dehalococcoidia bacterium]